MIAGTEALTYALVVLAIAWGTLTGLAFAVIALRSRAKKQREYYLDVQRKELLRSIMESE